MELERYVRETIAPNLVNGEMPEIEDDIEYFAELHSWYKHWRDEAVKVYPILRLGRERRNELCGDDDPDSKSELATLRWNFVIHREIHEVDSDLEDDSEEDYSNKKWWKDVRENLPFDAMEKRGVHLSHYFGNWASDVHKFHVLALKTECLSMWKEMQTFLYEK